MLRPENKSAEAKQAGIAPRLEGAPGDWEASRV